MSIEVAAIIVISAIVLTLLIYFGIFFHCLFTRLNHIKWKDLKNSEEASEVLKRRMKWPVIMVFVMFFLSIIFIILNGVYFST